MSKGILTNNKTGDTLHVTEYGPSRFGYEEHIAQVVGDGGKRRYFHNDDWTFTEDKPSVLDQFNAFPIGQTFVTDVDEDGEIGYWVKLSNKWAIYVVYYFDCLKTAQEFDTNHYTELFAFTPEKDN